MSVLWYGLESLGEIARAEVEGAAAAALGRAGAAWQRARPKVATGAATALAAVLTPPFVVGRLVLGLLDAYAPSRPVERWTVTVDGEEVPLAPDQERAVPATPTAELVLARVLWNVTEYGQHLLLHLGSLGEGHAPATPEEWRKWCDDLDAAHTAHFAEMLAAWHGNAVEAMAQYMPALEAEIEAAAREADGSVEWGGGVKAPAGQAAPKTTGSVEPPPLDRESGSEAERVACPVCDAEEGWPCMDATNNPEPPHKERVERAKTAAPATHDPTP